VPPSRPEKHLRPHHPGTHHAARVFPEDPSVPPPQPGDPSSPSPHPLPQPLKMKAPSSPIPCRWQSHLREAIVPPPQPEKPLRPHHPGSHQFARVLPEDPSTSPPQPDDPSVPSPHLPPQPLTTKASSSPIPRRGRSHPRSRC
jgi:hypothetical protein